MNRVAIAFSTCDRVELSRQSIEPLLQPDKFDLFAIDGSKTKQGKELAERWYDQKICFDVRREVTGGSGAAIVYALTTMLEKTVTPYMKYVDTTGVHGDMRTTGPAYDYIGLVENDVLLHPDWFDKTMALFEQGIQDGLNVGAVSARCYEDRILCQRDGYAIAHNLGAGMIIFTREAAELILNQYRTQWTTENRAVFAQLSGVDIGAYWAFRGNENFLVADWRWDALLASKGLASLALTPSPVTMIGQTPSLEEQGLALATGETDEFRNDALFDRYRYNLDRARCGQLIMPDSTFHRDTSRGVTFFAHQIQALGGTYKGDWKLRDAPGFGPFGWTAASLADDFVWDTITIPCFGPVEIMVGGGKEGGQIHAVDERSGFDARPVLPPEGAQGQLVAINVPGNFSSRTIRIEMDPGCTFYAIRCRDEQPIHSGFKFDWNVLPKGR